MAAKTSGILHPYAGQAWSRRRSGGSSARSRRAASRPARSAAFVDLLRAAVGAGRHREAVLVVAQLVAARQCSIDAVAGRSSSPSTGTARLPARRPSRCRRPPRAPIAAVLEHVPPPRVGGRHRHADVVGHDVDQHAHAQPRASARQRRQPLGAARDSSRPGRRRPRRSRGCSRARRPAAARGRPRRRRARAGRAIVAAASNRSKSAVIWSRYVETGRRGSGPRHGRPPPWLFPWAASDAPPSGRARPRVHGAPAARRPSGTAASSRRPAA